MFDQIAKIRELLPCPAVVDIGGKLSCNVKEVTAIIENFPKDQSGKVEFFNVDKHYPGSENKSIVAILYGELGTPEFASFHKILKNFAIDSQIDYVVRHYVKERPNRRLRLSGYGVELQMKSTEYKVQDDSEVKSDSGSEESSQEDDDVEIEGFNFAKLKTLYPDVRKDLDKFKQHLEESSSEMAPLKVWQFQELSLQAAERIMNAPKDEALKVFTHIAQNFPLLAKSLVKTVVNQNLRGEILKNQEIFANTLNLQPSDTGLFINGLFYDIDIVDIFGILDVLRQELRTMEGLHSIGLKGKRLSSLLELDFSDASGNSQEFAMDIRDSAVNWVNDVERDIRYSRWSTSFMELLRPTFPGMLRQVRRNIFNLVLLIDPTDVSMKGILKLVESFVVHSAPIRVGLVLSVNHTTGTTGLDDVSVAILCGFNYVAQTSDGVKALNFLNNVLEAAKDEKVTVEDVKSVLEKKFNADVNDVLGEDSDYDFGRKLSADFVQRTGLKVLPQALLNGIPLPKNQLTVDDFEEAVLQEVMAQTPAFQKAIFRGKLTDSHDIFEYIMTQPNVMPRLNERILNKDNSVYLDMSGTGRSTTDVKQLVGLSLRDMTATAVENLRYFSVKRKGVKWHAITYWLVGDLGDLKSRQLLLAALEHMVSIWWVLRHVIIFLNRFFFCIFYSLNF